MYTPCVAVLAVPTSSFWFKDVLTKLSYFNVESPFCPHLDQRCKLKQRTGLGSDDDCRPSLVVGPDCGPTCQSFRVTSHKVCTCLSFCCFAAATRQAIGSWRWLRCVHFATLVPLNSTNVGAPSAGYGTLPEKQLVQPRVAICWKSSVPNSHRSRRRHKRQRVTASFSDSCNVVFCVLSVGMAGGTVWPAC